MPTSVLADDDEQIIADLQRDVRRLRSRLATTAPRGGHDAWTAAATPATTYQLSVIPVLGTCEFAINGHEQREGVDYTVDADTGIVTVLASLSSGDLLVARYLVTDWLVARTLPADVGPIVTDNFNRADSTTTLGMTSDGLWTWNVTRGTGGISGNRCYFPVLFSGAFGFAVIDVGRSDCDVSVELVTAGSSTGLLFRYVDTSNYWAALGDGLYRVSGGSYTRVIAHTPVPADLSIRVVGSGNTIDYYVGGTHIGSTSSTFNNTATNVGLHAQTTGVVFDNFNVLSLP